MKTVVSMVCTSGYLIVAHTATGSIVLTIRTLCAILSEMRITREIYETIKPILDATKKNHTGVQGIYDLLGVSKTTATYIRESVDYEDYKRVIREKALRRTPRPDIRAILGITDDMAVH